MDLMIVEDKEIIRKGLRKIIGAMPLSFDRVFEAPDGERALEIVKKYRPQLIIADIRMPKKNGLEFIREARESKPDAKFVVLSGYSEFEYARTAVRLGVSAYLLKPVRTSELENVLVSLLKEIRREDAEAIEHEKMSGALACLDSAQKLLLEGMLKSKYGIDEANKLLEIFSGDWTRYWFAVMICAVYENGTYRAGKLGGRDMLATKTSKDIVFRFSVSASDTQRVILLGADTAPGRRPPDMKDVCNSTLDILRSSGVGNAKIGASEWRIGTESIPVLRVQAANALDHRFLQPGTNVFLYEIPQRRAVAHPFPIEQFNAVFIAVRDGESDAVTAAFQELWTYVERRPAVNPPLIKKTVVDLVFYILSHLYENLHSYIGTIDVESLYQTSSTFDEFKRKVSGAVSELSSRTRATSDSIEDPILYILRFLDTNYFQDLGLDALAEIVGMNANYLCSLFKRKTGDNLVPYLHKMRVEKAKRFLTDPSFKIIDVALEVGYSDDKYFHKIFKKYTGLTPTEYRIGLSGREHSVNRHGIDTTAVASSL